MFIVTKRKITSKMMATYFPTLLLTAITFTKLNQIKMVKGTIMGTAATMADETEEEEKSLVRWGKIIRKWSPSFKTIGKIIYNENSHCKN